MVITDDTRIEIMLCGQQLVVQNPLWKALKKRDYHWTYQDSQIEIFLNHVKHLIAGKFSYFMTHMHGSK